MSPRSNRRRSNLPDLQTSKSSDLSAVPELAEVELARRLWEPAIGRRITAVETHPRARIFRDCSAEAIESALAPTTLTASRAHGKRLFFSFSPPPATRSSPPTIHLELHLGMAGRLFAAPPDAPAEKHDHLLLRTSSLAFVFSDYRQFGRLSLHQGQAPWTTLPPQPLDSAFTRRHVTQLVSRRARRSLKALLLDQRSFPGIGNWLADEICWRLPCHPATPAGEIDPAHLWRVIRRVCRGALRHVADRNPARDAAGGFSPGRYVERVPPPTWLFQHRWRPGGTCPRCRSSLARSTIASRSTAWCPKCQEIRTSRA